MSSPKRGLGAKGLGIEALIQGTQANIEETPASGVTEVDIHQIEPNKNQPRRIFRAEALEELAASLKEFGVIQPVILKPENGYYTLIAGERRWRAAKIAGLERIPAIIRDASDLLSFEMALVENLQREDLNAIEQAESYRRLQNDFSLSQEAIAKRVGKSRSAVANSMRLLLLDDRVQTLVKENRLTEGHARALLGIEDKDLQFELSEHVIEEGLSVRETEALVRNLDKKKEVIEDSPPQPSDETALHSLEEELAQLFITKVRIITKKKKGKIELEYYSEEDLERLIALLKGSSAKRGGLF